MTLLTVVIPTIAGRELWLDRAIESYERTLYGRDWQLVVIRDRPTCGQAWNEAAAKHFDGGYIHLTADDIEAHDGWFDAGCERLDQGAIPAARILHGDGTLQSCGDEHDRPEGFVTEIARIPLLTTELAADIFPIPDMHYYTDNVVSDRARDLGFETVVTRDYLFTHHLAGEGRLDRLDEDHALWLESRR